MTEIFVQPSPAPTFQTDVTQPKAEPAGHLQGPPGGGETVHWDPHPPEEHQQSEHVPTGEGDNLEPESLTQQNRESLPTQQEEAEIGPTMEPIFLGDPNTPHSISFSGSGFISFYQAGVVDALRDLAPQMLNSASRVCGASAGSVVAALTVCGISMDEYLKVLNTAVAEVKKYFLGPFAPSCKMVKMMRQFLYTTLPEDSYKLASGKLHVAVTRVTDGENVVISEFTSKEELVEVLYCSCFVPVYCGLIPPTYRGVRYIDGGFTSMQPCADWTDVITISAFTGQYDICPRDCPAVFHDFRICNCAYQFSLENLARMSHALFPPDVTALHEYYYRGYQDTVHYLKRLNAASLQSPSRKLAFPLVEVFSPGNPLLSKEWAVGSKTGPDRIPSRASDSCEHTWEEAVEGTRKDGSLPPGSPSRLSAPSPPGSPPSWSAPSPSGSPSRHFSPSPPGSPPSLSTPSPPGSPPSLSTPSPPGSPHRQQAPSSPGSPPSQFSPSPPGCPPRQWAPSPPGSPSRESSPSPPGSPPTQSPMSTTQPPGSPPLRSPSPPTQKPMQSPTSPAQLPISVPRWLPVSQAQPPSSPPLQSPTTSSQLPGSPPLGFPGSTPTHSPGSPPILSAVGSSAPQSPLEPPVTCSPQASAAPQPGRISMLLVSLKEAVSKPFVTFLESGHFSEDPNWVLKFFQKPSQNPSDSGSGLPKHQQSMGTNKDNSNSQGQNES
ncbi:patatin-like phospholipase domain-containing protein 1 [Tachyglossus aculeatus]|uniref:patatin-like phospholipase domain-containing protein 1 n=1 Tax=Tachyglossus aculeatus TaxID=9261 RepID=UPI0018F46C2E|nr:patatin-like phospholipase domain-containing protein 1 [Tachyglossus aculeatus]